MYFQSYHIRRFAAIQSICFPGRSALLLLLLIVTSSAVLRSQSATWRYDTVDTRVGTDLPVIYNPQVAFDRWGVSRYTWVSRDPNSAGLQVYYSDDQSGEIGAPFLMTDIGSVYDSLGVDSSSYRVVVDREGVLHLAFLANVFGPSGLQIGLYYTNDLLGTFLESPPELLTQKSGRYDIAVDSFGVAHVIWLRENLGKIELNYWNSRLLTSQLVTSIPCSGPGCRFSDPRLESANGGLDVFVENDSGSLWHTRLSIDGAWLGTERLSLPRYDSLTIAKKRGDLRFGLALDPSGAYHLLFPRPDTTGLLQLLYGTNVSGSLVYSKLASLDSTLMGFDIAGDGQGKIAAVWTSYRGRFSADRPKTGFAEFGPSPGGTWQQESFIADLNTIVGNPRQEWRVANKLAISQDHVSIIGKRYLNRNDTASGSTGLFSRSPRLPATTYMLPDAAPPGMSLVVETYAPAEGFGMFGPDTLDPINVGLELVNPNDSRRLVIGPSVVSWDGRLLSTLIFVHPDATPGDIPIQVRVGQNYSNPQMFSIVLPQRLGAGGSGILEGGGILGSGGIYGTRSRRGVMVIDSLTLRKGIYTADVTDSDPGTDGEQGYLPLTVLSVGEVIIDSTATLTLSPPPVFNLDYVRYGIAGPGGGGGGAGLVTGGGKGYTAGGPPSIELINNVSGGHPGSGGDRSGRFGGGGSLNGTPGGSARPYLSAGGGTGHPFGSSGRYGQMGEEFPLTEDPGGYGGGTGGGIMGTFPDGPTSGGGGGGYATSGGHGGPLSHNGGQAVGSAVLVPLAGGSGGGGAYSERGRVSGGGGGGAISLYARRSIYLLGEIRANGGNGIADSTSPRGSGGGGGSGGGVLLGGQGGLILGTKGKVSVEGGKGGVSIGPNSEKGGDGGRGRVRVDGRLDYIDSAMTIGRLTPGYIGPASDVNGVFQAEAGSQITGVGVPGRTIRIYTRPEFGQWSYRKPQDVVVNSEGKWSVTLNESDVTDGLLYVAVLEKTENPSSDRRRAVPSWIMSTAGGAIVGQPDIKLSRTSIDFGCVNYPDCKLDTVFITNTGTSSDLVIKRIELEGAADWFLLGEVGQGQLRIPPGLTAALRIRFCPQREGDTTAILRLITNVRPDSLRVVALAGCGVVGKLGSKEKEIDLGDLCPDNCIDTTLTLINLGSAPLDVTSLALVDQNLDVEVLAPSFPFKLDPGQSRSVRVRACLRGNGGSFNISFRATTPQLFEGMVFRVRNIGPQVDLPASIDLGRRDVGADDTCRVRTFRIQNKSADRPLNIDEIKSNHPAFTLLSPQGGGEIPAGEGIDVVVRFCGEDTGAYTASLSIRFGAGTCLLDTTVQLRGQVEFSEPELDLNVLDKIDFGQVQLGSTSIPREVQIVNRGKGTARNVTWSVMAISPTGIGEIQASGAASPVTIPGERSESITLSMSPDALGVRQGVLILDMEGKWRDTVLLCVTGVEPGVTTDTLYLDFGGVRVGSSIERSLRIFNRGSFVDTVKQVDVVDVTSFSLVSLSSTLPVPLHPTIDDLFARLKFSPSSTGKFETSLDITTASGSIVTVAMVGYGLLEQGKIDIDTLRFGCRGEEPVLDSFVVRNVGTWPLTVNGFQFGGIHTSAFRMIDIPSSDIIDPGEEKFYRIEYLPGAFTAQATVRVLHSGREQLLIFLEGERCEPEALFLTFRLPEIAAPVGSTVQLPLQIEASRGLPEGVSFTVVISYDPTLLMPEEAFTIHSLVATNVKGKERLPGELRLEGKIPAGTSSGTLLEVPMVVLLGKTYKSDLTLQFEGDDIPSYYRLQFDNGNLTALDCDTTGTIDLGGVYGIKQNVPNPAEGLATIDFEIARRERVEIILYDGVGTVITTLLDQTLDRGEHRLSFATSTLSAGLYYYEIRSGRYRAVRQMIVVE